ncbi:uncharacterized protein LOC112088835 [Eutrema salsugineum]|uniref:uncharacterized protein LOC112088835 n=1 Tax=Eutrema salsugineum TaxID=72664 RepID=UPI000CED3F06|nr:uncharacterized protein LOC112088835 [Eutrema salsugineum]
MSDHREEPSNNNDKLLLEAMMAEMKKMMAAQFHQFRQEIHQHQCYARPDREPRTNNPGQLPERVREKVRPTNDPDASLEWKKKIELVFNCQHYTEINRVRVAATEFYDYALSWWNQVVTSRKRNGEYPVES